MNAMDELNKIADRLLMVILEDVHRRIGDWLASDGKKYDPYIEQQLRDARRFIK